MAKSESIVKSISYPYASRAWGYLERNLPALPTMAGKKIPGVYDRGHWRPMKGWQRYADALPTEGEVSTWEQWPGAGIALPLGGVSRLMALDFDVEGDPLRSLEFALAGLLVCRKRGRKGFTAFFRCDNTPWAGKHDLQSKFDITLPDSPVDERTGLPRPTRAVDIIAYGKQTVVPPSMHPDGMAYEWMGDVALDDCEIDYDIPIVPPDIIEKITAALQPWTTARDREACKRDERARHVGPTDSWYRDLNNHALANLHLWVPDLVHSKFLKANGDGYRAVPYWRGVFDSHKVGIHSSGIVDFAADASYTPLDLVMTIKQIELHEAIDWLESHSRMPQKQFASDAFISALSNMGPSKPQSLGFTFDPMAVNDDSPSLPESFASVTPPGDGKILPSYIASPPGMLGEISRYITNSAFRPQPQLSTAAAIIFASTVMGQLYKGPTGSRTNIYLMGVAESGAGKDHPFKCVHRLLGAANMTDYAGGSAMASGTAILSRLAWEPNTVY